MLLKIVPHLPVAMPRGVVIPLHGMTTTPVTPRFGTDVEGHADAVAGVVRGAAHTREVPVGAEISRAHLDVGLEAAGGEHDGLRLEAVAAPVGRADLHASDGAPGIGQQ